MMARRSRRAWLSLAAWLIIPVILAVASIRVFGMEERESALAVFLALSLSIVGALLTIQRTRAHVPSANASTNPIGGMPETSVMANGESPALPGGSRVDNHMGGTAGVLLQAGAINGDVNMTSQPPPSAAAALRTLPADLAAFTGRQSELERIVQTLEEHAGAGGVVHIDAIDGMAGVGKTAFAVHAAHHLGSRFPDGQFFVRLHAHTPGQRPVETADALFALLLSVGVAAAQIPDSLESRAALWRDRMAGKKALVVLDDATDSDQVRALLPGSGSTLVLVTSRRRLSALPQAMPITLQALPPQDAADLFVRLTARPGPDANDPTVRQLTELCGHLPLAIGLMAGKLRHRPAWTVCDLAADLASAADRLTALRAESHSVAAAFELSYYGLAPEQQRLFRRLGLHPGSDIDAYSAAALDAVDHDTAATLLDDLYAVHLVDEPARGRYRFHDLIRRHARVLADQDLEVDREAALDRLLAYYLHTAHTADGLLPGRYPQAYVRHTGARPVAMPELTGHGQAGEWMERERLNLYAALNHAAEHGRPDMAIGLASAMARYLQARGYWDQALALYHTATRAARQAHDELGEAEGLFHIGDMEHMRDDYPAAVASFTRALQLYRRASNSLGEANALNDLGTVQSMMGHYAAAVASHEAALRLYEAVGEEHGQVEAHSSLSSVHYARGDFAEAATHAEAALKFRTTDQPIGCGGALNTLAHIRRARGESQAALAGFMEALRLFHALGSRPGVGNTLNALGHVQYEIGDLAAAYASYTEALQIHRVIGNPAGEATSLNGLGMICGAKAEYEKAFDTLARAAKLRHTIGHRLGQAETFNALGAVHLAAADANKAQENHRKALAICREIGTPAEEAKALEGLGRGLLADAQPDEARTSLQLAEAIYRRLGIHATPVPPAPDSGPSGQ
ncbi:ATP-binding protein [Nonomuraea zeae]|uniref:Tetratricopeptide repeat protein n=1 Tax=Nonomuraea zeae TaxID=1642303 RepID=A0A5S4G100_9ACTN|nr:tetratricopeptide repeat protein [Nonomuraea zeae]TMR26532.1 tetratricopeptide repeat protein [Nonomuraea zeae]